MEAEQADAQARRVDGVARVAVLVIWIVYYGVSFASGDFERRPGTLLKLFLDFAVALGLIFLGWNYQKASTHQ